MKFNRLLFPGIILAGLLVYISCRKIDRQTDKPVNTSTESKFFTNHASSNSLVQAITQFVKGENSRYKFVDKLVKQIGYPYWDKATIVSKSHIGVVNRANTEDSVNITYIPFVRDSQNYVNASLLIKTSPSDTAFQFLLDWQYASYGFDTTSQDWNGRDIFNLFASFDKEVFGRSAFQITDNRLFGEPDSGKIVVVKIRPQQQTQQRANILISVTMCNYVAVCYGPAWYNSWCDGDCTEDCEYYTHTETECTTFWIEDGWTPGGGGTGGGSGSGGGGGSGNGGWNPPPCPGGTVRGATYENCTPGWIPPGEGGPTPPDPCSKAAPLKTDSLFKVDVNDLKGRTTETRESAFLHKSTGGRLGFYQGVPNDCEVGVPIYPTTPLLKSYIHVHNNSCPLPIFSQDDLKTLYELYSLGKTDSVFTFGVVTDVGVYLMVIDDVSALSNFYTKYFSESGSSDADNLARKYNSYKIKRSNTPEENEKRFLKFLKDEGVGVKLLKANGDLSGYSTIFLNKDNNRVSVPCPQ